jgi:hypothetical protein
MWRGPERDEQMETDDLVMRQEILADRKKRAKPKVREAPIYISRGRDVDDGDEGAGDGHGGGDGGDGGDDVEQTGASPVVEENSTETRQSEQEVTVTDGEGKARSGGDEELEAIRAARRIELVKQFKQIQENKSKGHGECREISEPEFLKEVCSSQNVICHFYHADFERCKVMKKHLDIVSRKYMSTKFMQIDADKCPFFVTKLQVRVLPCVIYFKDGLAIDRLVGFEQFGDRDDFETDELEQVLGDMGAIEFVPTEERGDVKHAEKRIYGGTLYDSDEEEMEDFQM